MGCRSRPLVRACVRVRVWPAAALRRLAGPVLIEQHDQWEAGERRYSSEASMLELATMNPIKATEAVTHCLTPIPP